MLGENAKSAVKVKLNCDSHTHIFRVTQSSLPNISNLISDLLNDDITKSAQCAQIVLNTEGFKAWRGWEMKCKPSGTHLPPLKECWRAAIAG